MISKLPVLLVSGALALSCAAHADDATFKAYGFADAEFLKESLHSDNFLILDQAVDPNTQLYLDHLNTYLDWKPNSNVRVLAEVAYNPDPAMTYSPGIKVHADSAAIFNDLYKTSESQIVQMLDAAEPGFSALPKASQTHVADSILQGSVGQLAAGTHQAVQAINAYPAQPNSSTSSKDDGITLPRVQADLLVRDEFNVRVGKFITPSGIWNVDHGSPAIVTIKQPYETNYVQIFPESQTGVQLFGHTAVGDHDLSYAGWVTTGRAGSGVASEGEFAQEPKNLDDWAWGTHLQADLAYLDGIRIGGTFHTGTQRDIDETYSPAVMDTAGTLNFAEATFAQTSTVYNRENCFGLDTKIQWKNFLLQGEWNHRQVLNMMANEAETNFDAEYILLDRRFPLSASLDVTPYAMFENVTWATPENNPALGLAGLPISGFSDYLAGLNFGIYNNVRLKLEYAYVQVHARSIPGSTIPGTFTNSELSVNQYAAQFSVAF